ncbi:MAG: hypothetical protein H2038_13455 [Brevundimonas sp.]|uniref:hypothetical protein n=1 Tax=Brevundimonas sp. TaxID=1871086 RepID=UPI0017D1A759|nr:hypothetical protein [Brevundimonas sp.]MBA4805650.1 hypothetical protein [Brevundimonas sp.]
MTSTDRRLLAGALLALALSATGLAAAATWLALRHMGSLAAMCGPQTPHCGWCVVAASAAIAALVALGAAGRILAPPRQLARRPAI